MKQQSRDKSRNKTRQKKKRHRKQTLQKAPESLIETIGQFTIHTSQAIGQGTYGKVYRATKQGSDQQFACKFIKQDRIDDLYMYYADKKVGQELQERLKRQGQFQLKLSKCPYIARMYKTEKNQKGFYFIMEYCETDLAKLLKKEIFLPQETALRYFKQIVEGIKYIYEKNAFHRDLKPENLLLKNDTIKISDFGFVKIFTELDKQCKSRRNRFQTQSKVGTFRYMSPDILALLYAEAKQEKPKDQKDETNQNFQSEEADSKKDIEMKYDPQKSDVWSLGVILYKMLYGKEPYDGKSFQEMIKKIQEEKLNFPSSIYFPPDKSVNVNVSKQLQKLIKKMLTPDQNQRINFMKLYQKVNSLLQEKQKEKIKSGIQPTQQTTQKNLKDKPTRNKKQRLLNVYNKIMVRIYKDLSTFATLRQIGIQNYSEFSYKIMTLLHQKRTAFLQSEDHKQQEKLSKKKKNSEQSAEVDEKVKQEISQYHNVFYQQIKSLSNLKSEDTLKSLLLVIYKHMLKYQDFDYVIKQVQLFLLFLLQLCCLEMEIIKDDYICALEDKVESLKAKSILGYKNDAIKLISDSLNGGQSVETKKNYVSKQRQSVKNKSKDEKSVSKAKQRTGSKSKTTKDKSDKKEKNKSPQIKAGQ